MSYFYKFKIDSQIFKTINFSNNYINSNIVLIKLKLIIFIRFMNKKELQFSLQIDKYLSSFILFRINGDSH